MSLSARQDTPELSSWGSHAVLIAAALGLILAITWVDGMWIGFMALTAAKTAAALTAAVSLACVAATTLCSLAYERIEKVRPLSGDGQAQLATFSEANMRILRHTARMLAAAALVCIVALVFFAAPLLQASEGRGPALFLVAATAGMLGVSLVIWLDLLSWRRQFQA